MHHPNANALHLCREEAVLVAHPQHLFATTGAATMTQVAHELLIVYDPGNPGSSYFQFINKVCRDAGITPKVEMTLDSVEAAKIWSRWGSAFHFCLEAVCDKS